MRRVVTIGTFDILHRGHINLIRKCAEIAGGKAYVTVGINTDEFVEKYKGQRPIMNYYERDALVRALKNVDSTQRHDGDTLKFLSQFSDGLSSLFLVVGSDWAKKDYHAQIGVTREQLDHLSYTLIYVDYTEGISSTKLQAEIEKRKLNRFMKWLEEEVL